VAQILIITVGLSAGLRKPSDTQLEVAGRHGQAIQGLLRVAVRPASYASTFLAYETPVTNWML